MIRYKVARPFTEYGIHHPMDSIIADASILGNVPVKLWDGTLIEVDDSGKVISTPSVSQEIKPVEVKQDVQQSVASPTPTKIETPTPKAVAKPTPKAVAKPVTK